MISKVGQFANVPTGVNHNDKIVDFLGSDIIRCQGVSGDLIGVNGVLSQKILGLNDAHESRQVKLFSFVPRLKMKFVISDVDVYQLTKSNANVELKNVVFNS